MPISVAIIGAGPAGFYTAEALLDKTDNVRIDIIERLPTPFGLIRAGVAPDHQSTKQVAKKFERTALQDLVHFYGNIDVGEAVSLDELRQFYDAVVLAVGAGLDRPLGIPGEHLSGVYGSASFVGWYNGHPDFRALDPRLETRTAVVIGNGNVALDVARVLVKSEAEMATSDLPDYAGRAIRAADIQDVYIVGRRGAADAKFTSVELREIGNLAECAPVVDAGDLFDRVECTNDRERRLREKNLAILRAFAACPSGTKPKRLRFRFHLAPVEIEGGTAVEAVRFERTRSQGSRVVGTGVFERIACGLVVAAVGYRSSPISRVPFDADRGLFPSNDGRVSQGLYTVGWAKRGPTGVIASNRPDGNLCAEQIIADVGRRGCEVGKPGRAAFERCLLARGVRTITFEDWQKIDAAELAGAVKPAPRRKFTTLGEMLELLGERGGRQTAEQATGGRTIVPGRVRYRSIGNGKLQ
jgi:NADPH-dependent glutamate synthase beta subunit-like oxidoreductase